MVVEITSYRSKLVLSINLNQSNYCWKRGNPPQAKISYRGLVGLLTQIFIFKSLLNLPHLHRKRSYYILTATEAHQANAILNR